MRKNLFKKVLSRVMLLVFAVGVSACSPANTKTNDMAKGKDKNIVVTTTFIKDMVKEVSKDSVKTKLIIPAGEDPHLFVAKPEHLDMIKNADLVLYHGLHFEGKMQEILSKKGKAITVKFTQQDLGKMEEDGKEIVDPHFWFDIKLYKKAVDEVAMNLSNLYPEKKDEFMKNTTAYKKALDELDVENKKMLSEIPSQSRYLVTPHDAFNYFSRAYDIKVVAPQGVSTDVEVSNKDIETTAAFIAEHKIKAIFSESTTNPERMKKLQEVVKQKGFDVKVVTGEGNELYSDSLGKEGEKESSFIEMYKHNIKLIYDNLK